MDGEVIWTPPSTFYTENHESRITPTSTPRRRQGAGTVGGSRGYAEGGATVDFDLDAAADKYGYHDPANPHDCPGPPGAFQRRP
jgi:hypothetical protein